MINKYKSNGNKNQYVMRYNSSGLYVYMTGPRNYGFTNNLSEATVKTGVEWNQLVKSEPNISRMVERSTWTAVVETRSVERVRNMHHTCKIKMSGVNAANPEKAAEYFIDYLRIAGIPLTVKVINSAGEKSEVTVTSPKGESK